MSETSLSKPGQPQDSTAKFHHIRSNLFRIIHADGVWYQMSPKVGHVHLIFYAERLPIPSETTYDIENGRLVKERMEVRKMADGFEREMEVDIMLDAEGAKHLFDDLRAFIEKNTPTQQ